MASFENFQPGGWLGASNCSITFSLRSFAATPGKSGGHDASCSDRRCIAPVNRVSQNEQPENAASRARSIRIFSDVCGSQRQEASPSLATGGAGVTRLGPNSEFRTPKEIRLRKPKLEPERLPRGRPAFGFRPSVFFRPSGFGIRSSFFNLRLFFRVHPCPSVVKIPPCLTSPKPCAPSSIAA